MSEWEDVPLKQPANKASSGKGEWEDVPIKSSSESPEFRTAREAGEKYFPKTPLPQILAPTVAAGAGELAKGAGSALELVSPEYGKKLRDYGGRLCSWSQ